MNTFSIQRSFATSLGLSVMLMAGCASVAVTDDAIERNTAFALGVDKDSITISNRENDGVKTTYTATTKDGKKHSCYVTGTFSVTGQVVSDAICSGGGRPAAGGGACNALLKAAGRC